MRSTEIPNPRNLDEANRYLSFVGESITDVRNDLATRTAADFTSPEVFAQWKSRAESALRHWLRKERTLVLFRDAFATGDGKPPPGLGELSEGAAEIARLRDELRIATQGNAARNREAHEARMGLLLAGERAILLGGEHREVFLARVAREVSPEVRDAWETAHPVGAVGAADAADAAEAA